MTQTIKTRFGEEEIEMITSRQFGPIPKIIYKYRPWFEYIDNSWRQNVYSKNIIEKQEIYIPSPKNFNDPFDCRIPIAYDLISKDESVAKQFFERLVSKNFTHLSSSERAQKITELMSDRQRFDENYVDQFNSQTEGMLHNQMSVYCATPVRRSVSQ